MKSSRVIFCLGFILLTVSSTPIQASDQPKATTTPTVEEKRYKEAQSRRKQAVRRAQKELGYDSLDQYIISSPAHDYLTLSYQISRLSALIHELNTTVSASSDQERADSHIPAETLTMPGILRFPPFEGFKQQELQAVYGPQGVSEKSVRLLLEYRLMLMDNPRLKVGEIKENEIEVTARVTTQEQAVVEAYRIDKNSGQWTPIP